MHISSDLFIMNNWNRNLIKKDRNYSEAYEHKH